MNGVMLQAALNGARTRAEHPRIPRTPEELAREGRGAVEAGAQVLHVHAFDADGNESLAADAVDATLAELRRACPGIPISLTTSAAIATDPGARLQLVRGWRQLPDLVTANMGEPGIVELCQHLVGRGVGIEAGLLSVGDAEAFVRSGLAHQSVRALVEPLDPDPADATAHAEAIESVLVRAGIALPQVHHGDGIASWAVSRRGLERGHGFRTGLEDTTALPDGCLAADNAQLVRTARALIDHRQP
jgi:uncharacterized protein (DUF849 family)